MFDIIRKPVAFIIEICYKIVPNYAIALLFFALIMKLILFPLGIKQQKNMVRQAKLRPKEQAIRKRYNGRTDKASQQKMQQEIMELYQNEQYNPASGCLPMIVQMVIVLALYQVVINPLHYICHVEKENINNIGAEIVELYEDGALESVKGELPEYVITSMDKQIADKNKKTDEEKEKYTFKSPFNTDIGIVNVLKKVDIEPFLAEDMLGSDFKKDELPNFALFGNKFDLSKTPSLKSFDILLIIPLLTFVFTYGSMLLTKKFMYQPAQAEGDAAVSMKFMDIVMPLMSTYFTFQVPAVVAVYWIYQNVFSTVQQFALKLMYPYPTFTDEEYKQAEREMNKGVKQTKKSKKNKSGNSAHRIDLDDEETAVNEPPKDVQLNGKPVGIVPPAALKDESDRNTD